MAPRGFWGHEDLDRCERRLHGDVDDRAGRARRMRLGKEALTEPILLPRRCLERQRLHLAVRGRIPSGGVAIADGLS
jgi:hypothetical protein